MKTPSSRSRALFVLVIQVAAGMLSTLAVVLLSYRLLGGILGKATRPMDLRVTGVMYGWRSPMLTKAMMVVTNLGAAYPIAVLVLAMIPAAWRRHRKEVLALAVVFAVGVLMHTVLKGMIHRPRPVISPLIGESGYSFPSGHAMNALVFYSGAAFFYCRVVKGNVLRLLVALLAAGVVALTGFSRVYLGVHYPSDVVAGYLIGAWWLASALLIGRSAAFDQVARAEPKNATQSG